MRHAIAAAAAAAALCAAPAQAGWYVKAGGGVSLAGDLEWSGADYETDTGYAFSGAIGRYLAPNFAVELEGFRDRVEYSCCNPNSNSSWSAMVNGVFEVPVSFFLRPYVGAGAGLLWVRYENDGIGYERRDTVGGFQLIGGLSAEVSSNIDLYVEYRYRDAFSDAEVFSSPPPGPLNLVWEYKNNFVGGGVRISF
ncbi:MAG: porin family protein [Parvularculaceae bacterium]|nr:porin family protein [Parvularculaceae bacterium]